MKNTTVTLFLLALVGNAFAADCATTTEKAKTQEDLKKELEHNAEVPAETQK